MRSSIGVYSHTESDCRNSANVEVTVTGSRCVQSSKKLALCSLMAVTVYKGMRSTSHSANKHQLFAEGHRSPEFGTMCTLLEKDVLDNS